jgi:dihydroxyacetone kinase-like predicted kinase
MFKAYLNALGDSIVVIADSDVIKVHIHTDRPGDVLNEALTYGQLHTYEGENLREQLSELSNASKPVEPVVAEIEKPIGVVAVCAGDGLTEVFTNLGADRVVSGGQTMNPSTEDILAEINKVPASTVYVLPNNSNIILTANQCVGAAEAREVVVIPSKTVPQGVAAMLAIEPDSGIAEVTDAMSAAINEVRTLSVTRAARDSSFDGLDIAEGDCMVMLENKLYAHSSEFEALEPSILAAIRESEPEFVTLYYGADAEPERVRQFETLVTAEFPNAEVTCVFGGQPVYEYIISVE